MVYLILAVAASSLVSVLMRLSEDHVKNNYAMFMANYFVCSAIAFCFAADKLPLASTEGLPFALGLGLFSGCCFLLNFVLLKKCIGKNGVMLSSVFMKLGVIVPTLMAIIAFGEKPGALQLIGLAVAVAAILVIYIEPSGVRAAASGGALLLALLLLASGVTESMTNIYDKVGVKDLKDLFLLFNFGTAMLLSAVITAVRHKPIGWKDIAFGAMIGVPNYFTSRCLLLSLGSMPAVVVYPIYNIGAIVLISIAGMLLFKERLGARKLVGVGLILAALVLLSI